MGHLEIIFAPNRHRTDANSYDVNSFYEARRVLLVAIKIAVAIIRMVPPVMRLMIIRSSVIAVTVVSVVCMWVFVINTNGVACRRGKQFQPHSRSFQPELISPPE